MKTGTSKVHLVNKYKQYIHQVHNNKLTGGELVTFGILFGLICLSTVDQDQVAV